jgi:spermidine/putrescine transport system substrate-binding protein
MNPMSRRTLLSRLGGGAAAAAFLAACGDDAETATTSASGESKPAGSAATENSGGEGAITGTLNFLNFTGWSGKTTYADFASAFPGAEVNEIAWTSADDTVAKAKGRAGDIDVVLVDGTTFPRLTALGVLAELGDIPNMAAVAEQYKNNSWDESNTFFAPTDHGRTGIIYRKDLVATAPSSWKDFFDMAPQYAGKIAVLDYQRSVMGSVLRMLGKPSSTTEQADLDAVVDVLLALKPNLLAIATEVGKTVVSGEAVMGIADAYDAQLALTSNPDVAWVDPSDGQVGYLEGLAILDGPRNALASAFINFFLEPKNYAAFINNVASPSVQPDNPDIDAVLKSSPVVSPPAEVIKKVEYHQFLDKAQADWDAAWDRFKSA